MNSGDFGVGTTTSLAVKNVSFVYTEHTWFQLTDDCNGADPLTLSIGSCMESVIQAILVTENLGGVSSPVLINVHPEQRNPPACPHTKQTSVKSNIVFYQPNLKFWGITS